VNLLDHVGSLIASRRIALAAMCAVCLGASAAAAGCGGADDTSAQAQTVISKTFSEHHDYGSGKLDANLSIGGGAPNDTSNLGLALSGPWTSSGQPVPKFAMETGVKVSGNTMKVKLISDGKAAWVDFSGIVYKLPESVFKAFESAYTGGASSGKPNSNLLDRLGFDPTGWVKSPEVVGDEKVGDTDTVHVKAQIDVTKLGTDLGALLNAAGGAASGLLPIPMLTDQIRAQLAGAVEESTFDLWSAKSDNSLRRVLVVVKTTKSGALPALAINFDIALTEVNQPQAIAIPTSSTSFGGLAGALAGIAGLVGGGEGSGSGAYSECVAKAKDADAVANCTKELVK